MKVMSVGKTMSRLLALSGAACVLAGCASMCRMPNLPDTGISGQDGGADILMEQAPCGGPPPRVYFE